MKTVEEIILNKIRGIDCTKKESGRIKDYIKENIVRIGEKENIKNVKFLFPVEFGEAILEKTITYNREPIQSEIKFGEGAIHYKEITLEECVDFDDMELKKMVISKDDNLKYYNF